MCSAKSAKALELSASILQYQQNQALVSAISASNVQIQGALAAINPNPAANFFANFMAAAYTNQKASLQIAIYQEFQASAPLALPPN